MTGAGVAASRHARIPFEAVDAAGTKLAILRIESDAVKDVGALMPRLGGGAMSYDVLPARMVTYRQRLRFVDFDGNAPGVLTLGEVTEFKEA
jgi:hypothetical protein